MTIGKLVEGCRAAIGAEATFTWVDADFLRERGIGGWVQMPVWIPPVGQYKGFHQTSLARAKRAGLTTRPLDETVRDTLKWFDEWQPKITAKHGWTWKPGERNTPGVSREQEAEVLAEWHAREG